MPITQITIPKHSPAHYVKGAVKFVQAQFQSETPTSQARLETCKKCDYYSENTKSADTGKKICRICRCFALEKSKRADVDKTEKCPMNFWPV